MALILCPECKNLVSEKADFCPNCGNPIGTTWDNDGNKKLSTIQKTSKDIKLGQIVATCLLFTSCFLSCKTDASAFWMAVFFISTLWLIILRFAKWWHHE